MADKKHATEIRAWLDGADIQRRHIPDGEWWDDSDPTFLAGLEYRIKPTPPSKQYPITAMSASELSQSFGLGVDVRRFANEVLRHAIDNGQVAPLEAYSQCAADLLKAEETIRKLNEARHQRDMAVAKAVSGAHCRAFRSWGEEQVPCKDEDLEGIIDNLSK